MINVRPHDLWYATQGRAGVPASHLTFGGAAPSCLPGGFGGSYPVARIRLMPPSTAQLEHEYYAEKDRKWRVSCWCARPTWADPALWYASVAEVARLVGEDPPPPRNCEPNLNPFGSWVTFG